MTASTSNTLRRRNKQNLNFRACELDPSTLEDFSVTDWFQNMSARRSPLLNLLEQVLGMSVCLKVLSDWVENCIQTALQPFLQISWVESSLSIVLPQTLIRSVRPTEYRTVNHICFLDENSQFCFSIPY